MKADFLFAGLNWNRIMQKKQCQKKVHSMDDALKTRGIIYLNVETGFLFATPHQNFWLHAWAVPGLPVRPAWAITAAYHRCLAVCKCCPWRTCTAVLAAHRQWWSRCAVGGIEVMTTVLAPMDLWGPLPALSGETICWLYPCISWPDSHSWWCRNLCIQYSVHHTEGSTSCLSRAVVF